jgi:protein-S-isoprenylcysteine O-methyltransferase Ste14
MISSGHMKPRVPPPVVALVAAVVMWLLHRRLPMARWIEPPWSWLGIVPAAVGVGLDVHAFRHFRHVGTTVNPMQPQQATRLVTDGIFGLSRNPMYFGLLLILIGWAMWLGTASEWLVPPLFMLGITYAQIVPEERALGELFGAQYLAYRRDVTRWIGRSRTRS